MKRRDITLGEMQDTCQFRGCDCTTLGGGMCDYFDVCEAMHNKKDNFQSPCDWGLTDPPRFNEAQVSFAKMWLGLGAQYIARDRYKTCVYRELPAWYEDEQIFEADSGGEWAIEDSVFNLSVSESINLSSVVGKDE